jgi:hypothetical protein
MTAVELLKSKIIEDIRLDDVISGSYSKEQYKLFLLDKIEYALEMEKEQHGETWNAAIQAHENRGFVISRSLCDFDEYFRSL